MARQEIINGISYNEGFNRANNNFVELYQQATDIQNRGYVYVKDLGSNVDFNNLKTQGKYIVNYSAHSNAPNQYEMIYFINITGNPEYLTQEATDLNSEKFYRVLSNNIWGSWRKISTTEKTEINIPLASGFVADIATVGWKHKIIRNSDGSYDLWFAVKKADNSNIPTGYIQIGSMVAGHIPNAFYIGNGLSVENDTSFAVGFCYVDNSRLMFHNIFASAKSLRGYIRFRTN